MIHTSYTDVTFKKGDEMGYFQMGSTIVMVMPRDYMELEISRGDKVTFGQTIGFLPSQHKSVPTDLFSGAL
jgi:hypothetical protein